MSFLKHIAPVVFLSLAACFSCHSLFAQQDLAVQKLIEDGRAFYNEKDFQQSLERYSAAILRGSTDSSVAYNAACCAALTGQEDQSFDFIDKAIALGWMDAQHLQRDSDLNSLHEDPRWPEAIAKLESLIRLDKNRWSGEAFQTKFAKNLSSAEKAAGLSKLWAEVKFNFVNFHLVPDLDWDAEYVKCMSQVLESESTLEYYRLLERLVAQLKDAHTNVYLPGRLHTEFNARPALRTRLIEDRVIVVSVLDSELSDAGIKVGQEVLKVDGQPVKDYAEQEVKPYMAASTPQDLATRTYESSLLRGSLDKQIELELMSLDGTPFTRTIDRTSTNRIASYLNRSAPFSFDMLDDNIAYVRLTSFGSAKAAKAFGNAFDKIEKADGLIIDLRENGGGSSSVGWGILGYLTDKPFQTTRWHTLQYRPTHRAWNRQSLSEFGSAAGSFAQIAPQHYRKPVSMLIGPRTFSAAEDMAAAYDMLERGKLIGQPTGGSTGQPLMFPLPGGGRARVCTKHDSYADGTQFVGKGIQPDILVEPRVQDIIDGVDRALDVARKELLK